MSTIWEVLDWFDAASLPFSMAGSMVAINLLTISLVVDAAIHPASRDIQIASRAIILGSLIALLLNVWWWVDQT